MNLLKMIYRFNMKNLYYIEENRPVLVSEMKKKSLIKALEKIHPVSILEKLNITTLRNRLSSKLEINK